MLSFVGITLNVHDEANTDSPDRNDLRSGCNKMPRKACFAGVPANFRLGLVETCPKFPFISTQWFARPHHGNLEGGPGDPFMEVDFNMFLCQCLFP